jgi:hypothetical protein
MVYIKSNIKFFNIESESIDKNDDIEVESLPGETMEIETNEYEYESIASENEDVSSSSELCDDDTITIDSIDTDNVQEIEETDNDICGTKIYAKKY